MDIVAHGLGGVRDLPVPTWIFYWGGAFVLVVSFVLLGVLWREPLLARLAHGRVVPRSLDRVILGTALRVAIQSLSVVLFVLVFVSALVGDTDPFRNLAPTWIYVVFWLGVPLLSTLLGNVWRVLSPWLAIADGFVWLRERTGGQAQALAEYPDRLGRWPAAVALFGFVAFELAYTDPASPRALAFGIALYTYITLFGYAAFGRETWQDRGEGFAVAFSFFARMAPFVVADGRLVLRWPFTGLHGTEGIPGSLAVISVRTLVEQAQMMGL